MGINGISVVLVGDVVQIRNGGLVVDVLLQGADNRTGCIAVVVDYRLVVATVFHTGSSPLGSLGTILAVDHKVVEHVDENVLLNIDATALGAVATPSRIDDGVVVCHTLCLSASCCVVLTGA